ncbi:hypothetical protein PHRODO_10 [Bacillus phage Phrodo]|uniref:hypothetical protein n=1 Tax=Bacillus phage Phrodo TaxID=1805953 RepID=UPI0007A7782F|nr:hypothetical protein BI003_gp010 [Bacillus phage Phrodo]AMW62058.1 hypothetical protein PHRODO_10 [Bacillus phage Phrodo]
MVSIFTKVKHLFVNEPEEKHLVDAFVEAEIMETDPEPEVEVEVEVEPEPKVEEQKEEEPEVKEKEPFPIEVGDILYKCDVVGGEPILDWKCVEIAVTSINEYEDTFMAEPTQRGRYAYLYPNEHYLFSVKDMMRQPFIGYKEHHSKEKALTYREKLVMENELWRGKPKAGDIFYGKRFIESDKTYSTITGKFKVLGVTLEAFSAAPIDKDNNLDENETLIFNNDTLLEITLHGRHPVQLFTTQNNAHTAYLHKQIEKKNREAAQ